MKIFKTKTEIFKNSHAVVWSILVHLLFLNYLPDFSSLDSIEQKRQLEKVRLDIIEKKIPLEKIKREPKKSTTKKEVFRNPIKHMERTRKITNSKIKPLPIQPVQKKPILAKAINRVPRNFSKLKPLPITSHYKNESIPESIPAKQYHSADVPNISTKTLRTSPITLKRAASENYAGSPYASMVIGSKNSSLSKVSYNLKPKGSTPIVTSPLVSPKGIAQRHRSKRVFMSSFSPTPLPVISIEVEREKENSLSKEELDGIWRQYTNSIQVKIAKAKSYPALAKRRGHQGKAILSFKLSRDGNVLDLKVEKSTGHKSLDQAALRAIREGGPYPIIPKALNEKSAYLKIPISFVINQGKQ
jgi:TonB family protein